MIYHTEEVREIKAENSIKNLVRFLFCTVCVHVRVCVCVCVRARASYWL